MRDDQVLERLQGGEDALRVAVERLRGELKEAEERLAGAQEALGRVVVARELVGEVIAEDQGLDLVSGQFPAGERNQAVPGPVEAAGSGGAPVVRLATGEVPGEADWPVLAALARSGGALSARQVCQAAWESSDHRRVETLRMRLKRMVARGWLAEETRGRFQLAEGIRALV